MDNLLYYFRSAIQSNNAQALASTITPAAPPNNPGLLYAILRSSSNYDIEAEVRYGLSNNRGFNLKKQQSAAWLEIYVAYYKVVAALVDAEEKTNQNKLNEADWGAVYECWKDVTNGLVKGFNSGHFENWMTPCLYVAGRYLRIFAIKADDAKTKTQGAVTFNAGFQDDIVGALGKNEKLEDAARQINRIFSLCLSDR
jgi:COP9 signalosome complex subunit 12